MKRDQSLSIGKLARVSGVNLETIRYYERIGLMPTPERTAGGHRLYQRAHRRRLSFVRRARELGFTIGEIRTLLDLAEPGRRSCDEVHAVAAAHLQDVRAKIADLARLELILTETVSRCQQGSDPSCPVLGVLEA